MPWQISQDTLYRTTECPRNFTCLEEGKCGTCKIEGLVKGDGVWIAGDRPEGYCPYLMSFGKRWICNCPTRYEIYERYAM